jgi:uncharacterized membrane protein
MKNFLKYFLRGLLFVVPAAVTIYVLLLIFSLLASPLQAAVKGMGIWEGVPAKWAPVVKVLVKVLGAVLSVALIALVGALTSFFITRPLIQWLEKAFTRLPLVKLLYTSLKDLISAFVGEKKRFDRPVLVQIFPGSNLRVVGFITRDSLEILGLKDEVAVYLPQSYNFAGFLAIVPRTQVTPLSLDSADAMAFIVSGGVSAQNQVQGTDKECLPAS